MQTPTMRITVYELYKNTDTNSGGGHSVIAARFRNYKDAINVCNDPRFFKRFGIQGHAGNPEYDVKEVTYEIYGNADEYFKYLNDDVKRKALAKLTEEEKIALQLPREA